MRVRWMHLIGTTALLVFGVFLLAGCGDSVTMSDPAAVDVELMLREFLEEDGLFDDLGPYEAGSMSSEPSDSRDAIDPLTYWRRITDRDCSRDIHWDPEEGTAEVTVHREVWGILTVIDEDMVEYEKPFHHEGIRYANFIRDEEWQPPNGPPDDQGNGSGHRYRRGPWVLTELSGFVARSDTLTVSIDWIRIQSATVDVTVTDPLDLLTVPDDIMAFDLGEEVTVTVAGPPADAILFLHTRHWKSPLQFDGGTFTGSWTVNRAGRHNAWIEAMAHDTIHDSEYPDDVLIWGMPYVVAEELDE